jgi:hypothetical protein
VVFRNNLRSWFLSSIGFYLFLTSAVLIFVSALITLLYQPGLFNFTDTPFNLLTYPLGKILNFNFDPAVFTNRAELYLIVPINLLLIIYVLDLLYYLFKEFLKIFNI